MDTRRSAVARLCAVLIAAGAALVGCTATNPSPESSSGMSPTAQESEAMSSNVSDACGTDPPTVVMVHGAWADTSSWSGEVSALRAAGCEARAVANPLLELTTDAETIASFVRSIDGPVVLVGHSYGGSVITNAAAQVENVRALVYVDAAAPAPGETTASLSGDASALSAPDNTLFDAIDYPGAPSGAQLLYLKQDIFVSEFANGMPADEAERLWAAQRAASSAAFSTPSKDAAWQTIPSWYFISSGDKIITPESEMRMADRAGSTVTTYDGGSHLTLISDPDAVTEVIAEAIVGTR